MNDETMIIGPRADLIDGWTALWNGDLDCAAAVCSPDIRIHFGGVEIGKAGDQVTTPREMAALIGQFRTTRPGLRYEVVQARTTGRWGHCVWDATMGELHVGGIDIFGFSAAGIDRVWSVTAQRSMTPRA